MKRSVYSVAQVNSYIRNMFEQDFLLGQIQVKGEISNLKYHTSGHIYFSLKDQGAVLSCVMFAGNSRRLRFRLENGQRVVCDGQVSVYERDGKYQLYAKDITLDGIGSLYEEYERLKTELEERGLFAEEYKQPIPKYIETLGVVTSPTGAAVRDIINVATRRNPHIEIILYPALVQGDGAAETIAEGIEMLERLGVDCIIVGRGGGSIEDLWAFNEEITAQAIFDCSVPIISAVGHETDFTIADFVSDLRAPTPSAAAELAVYEYDALVEQLERSEKLLEDLMHRKLEGYDARLEHMRLRFERFRPDHQIASKRLLLDQIQDRLQNSMHGKMDRAEHRLELLAQRMKGVSPLDRISKGYAFVTMQDGTRLKSIEDVKTGNVLTLTVSDGEITASVLDRKKINR